MCFGPDGFHIPFLLWNSVSKAKIRFTQCNGAFGPCPDCLSWRYPLLASLTVPVGVHTFQRLCGQKRLVFQHYQIGPISPFLAESKGWRIDFTHRGPPWTELGRGRFLSLPLFSLPFCPSPEKWFWGLYLFCSLCLSHFQVLKVISAWHRSPWTMATLGWGFTVGRCSVLARLARQMALGLNFRNTIYSSQVELWT